GLLDSTLVLWTGEFGRTPRVGQSVVGGAGAGRDGRDHWPHCFSSVLAGAGVRGGTVFGASDRWAASPARDAVPPADLAAPPSPTPPASTPPWSCPTRSAGPPGSARARRSPPSSPDRHPGTVRIGRTPSRVRRAVDSPRRPYSFDSQRLGHYFAEGESRSTR